MAKLKFSLSPLFVLAALAVLLFGNSLIFLSYLGTVLLHEYAHFLCALRFGLRMDEVRLYPFGAVLYGQTARLKPQEEILVALAGPGLNAALALIFTALWWMVPELYPLTDSVVMANLSMAVCNLLPVYPLDGGRVVLNLLLLKFPKKKALRTLNVLTWAVAGLSLGLYLLSPFFTFAPALGVFAMLLSWSALFGGGSSGVRPFRLLSARRLRQGVRVRRLAVSEESTLFEVLRGLSPHEYAEVVVLDAGQKPVALLSHARLVEMTESCDLHRPLAELLSGEARFSPPI